MGKIVRKHANGEYYVHRRAAKGFGRAPKNDVGRDWWLINAGHCVDLGRISFPPRMFGKKVRFKIEFVEE